MTKLFTFVYIIISFVNKCNAVALMAVSIVGARSERIYLGRRDPEVKPLTFPK